MDIQNVLNKLHSLDSNLADQVRACFNELTSDRDQAIARAREAVAQAAEDKLAKARKQLASEGQVFEHVETMPKKFLLRQEFDRLLPADKMAAVKSGIRIVD